MPPQDQPHPQKPKRETPWIHLGHIPPPPLFPATSTPSERAALRFRVTGNAVLTGGTGTLALTTARALLEHGLSNLALLDLPAALETPPSRAQIASLRADFPASKIVTYECDVTDESRVRDLATTVVPAEIGVVSILVCFAGVVDCVRAEEEDDEDKHGEEGSVVRRWRRVLDVNATGCWVVARGFGCQMIHTHTRGKIVLISSISAHRVNYPQPQAAYNVSKAAVSHLARCLAGEWAGYGIRVNSISPGYMDTPLNEGEELEGWRRVWVERHPMGRMGVPEEITGPVVLLCSEVGGGFVCGADLVVDGGGLVF